MHASHVHSVQPTVGVPPKSLVTARLASDVLPDEASGVPASTRSLTS